MPRPKTKAELLSQSAQGFEDLKAYIDGLEEIAKNAVFPKGTMNRNIRDVLAHLHHWHLLFLEWYRVGMAGGKPEMPASGYSWKTTPALNLMIWESCQSASLSDIQALLEQSHNQVHAIIEDHSEEELFEKKKYKWTGATSLGAYLVSATSSHYAWALKLIKKAKKKG